MSKYIELSRALMYIADIQLTVSDASKPTIAPRDLCEWIFEGIKDLPTIEVSEDCLSRAEGKWIKQGISPYEGIQRCCFCDKTYNITEDFNYCPNCGAKMKGGAE